jgi:agmatinase
MTGSEAAMQDEAVRLSLFGWPEQRQAPPEAGALCVIGAPSDHGNVISRGSARGPDAIRLASLDSASPAAQGLDLGDVDRSDSPDPETYMDRVAAAAYGLSERGLCPLLLGGDHSITYAPVSMLARSRDLCLVWFDAHTDFSPWSGRTFHNHKQVLRRIAELEGVSRIVQIGYRGITVGDERSLGANASVVTTARARLLDEPALLALVPAYLPCYVSIDIDVVDPFWAPGTSAPVPDGLLPRQVEALLRTLVRHREIVGADLVEVNPALDLGSTTSRVAAELLGAIVGEWGHQRALRQSSDQGRTGPPPGRGDAASEAFAPEPSGCEGN